LDLDGEAEVEASVGPQRVVLTGVSGALLVAQYENWGGITWMEGA